MGLAFVLILLVIAIHWWDRAGLKDNLDDHISFIAVVYFTMISITTIGFDDIASVGGRVELVERVVSKADCGNSIVELQSGGKDLRAYRNGRPIGF